MHAAIFLIVRDFLAINLMDDNSYEPKPIDRDAKC